MHAFVLKWLGQLQSQNATVVAEPGCADTNHSYNPPPDMQSSTVTVTLTAKCSISYYLNNDARAVAQQLLQQAAGPHYQLLTQLTRVGQPVKKSVDAAGDITLLVPIAGIVEYQIPDNEVQAIQSHIKGMKTQAAQAFIKQQAGIDPQTAVVSVTYGTTVPNDVGQIKIKSVNPINLPTVQLPPVPITATSTAQPTP